MVEADKSYSAMKYSISPGLPSRVPHYPSLSGYPDLHDHIRALDKAGLANPPMGIKAK
jgi:hypothetical protein